MGTEEEWGRGGGGGEGRAGGQRERGGGGGGGREGGLEGCTIDTCGGLMDDTMMVNTSSGGEGEREGIIHPLHIVSGCCGRLS